MARTRWGVVATGGIASQFAESLRVSPRAEVVAVASRSMDRAAEFAETWRIPRAYGTYAALLEDPSVDVVYVATPHHLHHAVTMAALDAGKHVVCEKPLALNARQAEEMIDRARSANRLLLEAMWMKFNPAILTLQKWVTEGLIGNVRLLTASFSFNQPFDPNHRLFDPALGGGSLLDLGIYPLTLATMQLGFPDSIQASAVLGDTGVDEAVTYNLEWRSGALAQLFSGLRVDRPIEAAVWGASGSIRVPHPFFRPDRLVVELPGSDPEEHLLPYRANGYIHEIEAVHDTLDAGGVEVRQHPLDETLRMMELMDQLRAEWGVVYPGE